MATLTQIAWDMMAQAQRHGVAQRDLARGLSIQFTCIAGERALFLRRPDAKPGENEVTICKAAFSVPAGAERHDLERTVTLRWPAATPSGGGE